MNKPIVSALIALLAATPALAQEGAAPPKPATPPEAAPLPDLQLPPGPKPLATDWAPGDTDAAAVGRAEALLAKVTKAYQDAPTLSDTIKLTSRSPFGEQTDTLGVAFAGQDLRLESGQMTLVATGGKLFMDAEGNTRKFLEVPITDGVDATLNSVMPGFRLPVPYRELRAGKTGDDLFKGFSLGVLEGLKPAGLRQKDGKDQILMRATNGDMVVTVDPATSLISSIDTVFTPPQAPPGMTIGVEMAMSPKLGPSLENPIVPPAANGRKAVATMADLMAPISVGDQAMEFTLVDHTGATVKSADLKGSVVVLDFWASWCAPCQRGLPKIDEVAKWAAESGKTVKFFGVNVWERVEKDERQPFAAKFWPEKKFTFPTLVDAEDTLAKAYGIQAIPVTLVIGPDGRIAAVHEGADPEMVATLKSDIEKALGTKTATP